MRNPAKQARLSRLIRQPEIQLRDDVDAHVVVCARRADQAVFTSDPEDLRRLAPELTIIEV